MWCFTPKKAFMRAVEWAGALSWWSRSARSVIVNATVTQYTRSFKRRLTAYWLAPRESDYLRMRRKVSSDWLPSYIKATRPVLEIFNMAGYFPDSPRTWKFNLRRPLDIKVCVHWQRLWKTDVHYICVLLPSLFANSHEI